MTDETAKINNQLILALDLATYLHSIIKKELPHSFKYCCAEDKKLFSESIPFIMKAATDRKEKHANSLKEPA